MTSNLSARIHGEHERAAIAIAIGLVVEAQARLRAAVLDRVLREAGSQALHVLVQPPNRDPLVADRVNRHAEGVVGHVAERPPRAVERVVAVSDPDGGVRHDRKGRSHVHQILLDVEVLGEAARRLRHRIEPHVLGPVERRRVVDVIVVPIARREPDLAIGPAVEVQDAVDAVDAGFSGRPRHAREVRERGEHRRRVDHGIDRPRNQRIVLTHVCERDAPVQGTVHRQAIDAQPADRIQAVAGRHRHPAPRRPVAVGVAAGVDRIRVGRPIRVVPDELA